MTRTWKATVVLLVAAVGLWGCARSATPHWSAQAERIRTLEAKCVKLEDDYRGVVSTRDQMRKHLAGLEAENARLDQARQQLTAELQQTKAELQQAKAVQQECDQLRKTVDSRTTERDALQVRCERLKKGLQSLLGQDEPTVPAIAPTSPVSTTTEPTAIPEPAQGGQS